MPTQAASTKIIDESILGEATLEPGQEAKILLGLYEKGFPEPEFEVNVSPTSCSISSVLEKAKDDSGEYRLTYRLRNGQGSHCLVTVRQLS